MSIEYTMLGYEPTALAHKSPPLTRAPAQKLLCPMSTWLLNAIVIKK